VTANSSPISLDHPKRIKIKYKKEAPDHQSKRSESNPSDGFDHEFSIVKLSRYFET
jgi:hypothetical protein